MIQFHCHRELEIFWWIFIYKSGDMYPSTCRQCGLGFRQASHWRDKGLRHGTKFGVPVSEELVSVYVGMRGDARRCGSGEVVRAMSWDSCQCGLGLRCHGYVSVIRRCSTKSASCVRLFATTALLCRCGVFVCLVICMLLLFQSVWSAYSAAARNVASRCPWRNLWLRLVIATQSRDRRTFCLLMFIRKQDLGSETSQCGYDMVTFIRIL